jgi:hypothetical protein
MTPADLRPPDDRSVVVAVYPDYASAQRAVDFLSDNKFPVHRVAIVGEDIKLVEHVLGRMTVVRAALMGAAAGAWFGLFIGLLLGIFANSAWLAVLLFAIVIGALWGAAFAAVGHALTRGQRDFQSISTLQAARYAVTVPTEHAEAARRLLASLGAQTAGTR